VLGRTCCTTLSAAILCATLLTAGVAKASPDLVLDNEQVSLAGTHRFRIVTLSNGSTLRVLPYAGDPKTGGRLEILAHYILIDGTSTIDATAAGYRGLPNADGEGEGGGKGAAVSSDATGGGGHGAPGGAGVLSNGCVAIAGATGGPVSTAAAPGVAMGGAGSAAGTADGDDGGRGGHGGGVIVLRAGRIELDGAILANGEPGGVYADDAAGGGAGGGILLQASQWLGFGGMVQADGALGGVSTKCEGGAGGGGFVRLFVQGIPPGVTVSQRGGVATCLSAHGQDTSLEPVQPPGCLDLDGDGFQSDQCGGTDCDDSDLAVNKGGVETCNGQDDDCDGFVDEGSLCAGQCVDGACVPDDAGVPDSGADAAPDSSSDAAGEASVTDAGAETSVDAGEVDGGAGVEGGAEGGDGSKGLGEPSITLRGGCQASVSHPQATMGWVLFGLAIPCLVRTWRRRR
jgi:hypothetical protein